MRTLRTVFDLFPGTREHGLAAAQVADSRTRFGVNKLTPLPREPVWKKLLEKFDDPIIQILLAASLLKIVVDLFAVAPLAGGLGLLAVLAVAVGSFVPRVAAWVPTLLFSLAGCLFAVSAALGHPSVEGLAVMVAVGLATGVSFLSEYRSDREFDSLNAGKEAAVVKVVRNGTLQTLPQDEVLVGELVVLEPGDEIPADGRLVSSDDLKLDQSLMTGESEWVAKTPLPDDEPADGPDSPGCLFRGTQVIDGLGRMTVTNVGDDTMLGQIARKLSGAEETEDARENRVHRKLTISKELTPLQQKLASLAGLISKVGYAAAAAIFVALLVRGLLVREVYWPANGAESLTVAQNLLGYFVYMVIVIVVAVPEGLPMSVTVSLALAMRKMTRANALVRQLVATETIGSATVICSDKTGTLTQNKMRVVRVCAGGIAHEPPLPTPNLSTDSPTSVDWLGLNAALNSTASLEPKNGTLVVVGNNTEGALLHWLHDSAADFAKARLTVPVVARIAFSSETKRMTTVVEFAGKRVALVKGAPEFLLDLCPGLADGDREIVRQQIATAAGQAMRTLAFAHAEVASDAVSADGVPLVFDGFVAIRDPLRPDVTDAVAECRAAGIEVKMITGDNAETATAIARDAGLLDVPDAAILTSDEFNKLSDDEVKALLPRLRVLARARPLDKYRMVTLLQEMNHVVAMTGDGTNDAPSLKKADVGLAMGIAGTEVAKEASKIVLLDDSFSTIVKAVHWGRSLYENIQRFIQFQLTINVSALVIAFLGPFFGLKPPFTVLQLLWINVIMDTFAAIALCSEPPRAGLMRVRPKRRDESILTRAMIGNIGITAAFFVVVMIGLLKGMENAGWFAGTGEKSDEFPELTVRQVAIFFTVYVFFQVWNQINCRSLTPEASGLAGVWRNPYFLAVASLTVVGQLIIVTFGGAIFAVEPLGLWDWLTIAAATASVLLFAEISRFFRRGSGQVL